MANATINVNKQIEYKVFIDDLMKIITLTANKLGLDELNTHENYPSLIVTGTITDISTAQKLETPISVYLTQDILGNFTFDGTGEIDADGTIHVNCPVSINPDLISTTNKPNTIVVRDDEGNIYANDIVLQGDINISGSINMTNPNVTASFTRLVLTNTTDAQGNSPSASALITGNPDGEHLVYDTNEIMAKSSPTTTSTLYLNNDGGNVTIGTGGLTVKGAISANNGINIGSHLVPTTGSTLTCGSTALPWNIISTRYLYLNSANNTSTVTLDGRNTTIRPVTTGTGYLGTTEYYWQNAYINNVYVGGVQMYAGATNPTGTSRINANGYFYATRVYNAVYNDYAECFDNISLKYEDVKNRIVELDSNGCTVLACRNSNKVIGIVSDSYAMLLNGTEDEIQEGDKIPVGLVGTLFVKAKKSVDESDIGKFVVSDGDGYAKAKKKYKNGTCVGKIIGINKINNTYRVILYLH